MVRKSCPYVIVGSPTMSGYSCDSRGFSDPTPGSVSHVRWVDREGLNGPTIASGSGGMGAGHIDHPPGPEVDELPQETPPTRPPGQELTPQGRYGGGLSDPTGRRVGGAAALARGIDDHHGVRRGECGDRGEDGGGVPEEERRGGLPVVPAGVSYGPGFWRCK